MQTLELLAELARARGLKSDYAVAKYLNITTQRMSRYRRGIDNLGDELAVRIADELGIDAGAVLADLSAERAKSDKVRAAWKRLAKSAAASALVVFLALIVPALMDATPSAEAAGIGHFYTLSAVAAGALWLALYLLIAARAIDRASTTTRDTQP